MEDVLCQEPSLDCLVKCFVSAKANSFENLLDPFLKIFRISTAIAIGVAKSQFFKRLIDKRILLVMVVTYLCQALDKGTMSFASVMGIKTDANLVGQDVRDTP